MDISLVSRRAATETFVVDSDFFIKSCLLTPYKYCCRIFPLRQSHIIPIPVLLLRNPVNTITKQRVYTCLLILISFLLTTSHVVAANPNYNNYSRSSSNDTINNSSAGDGVRRARYAGANSNGAPASAMVLRPEFFLVPLGGVIHLFPRYGYLSLSMKVIAKNSSGTSVQNDTWMFLEPVNNVIEPRTLKVDEIRFSSENDNESLPFHNLFHFDLCEDVRALLEAYFKNFSIEGLDKPWQAWAGGWRSASIARNFGIEQHFVEGDYRYVLVKVLLVRGSGVLENIENTTVAETYSSNFLRFIPENELSSYEFFKVVGTHYIHSYIMGNAIYQVFVYDPDGFQAVKRRLFLDGIKDENTAGSTESILESLLTWVKHMGQVNVLNAEPSVIESVRNALIVQNSANLLKLHDNASLVESLEALMASQPNGILGIDLRGIQFMFTDPIKRAGFQTALKHKMQLWEINFLY